MTSPCPYCGRSNQQHRSVDGDSTPPCEGDASICWGCRQVAEFDAEGGLREPSPERRAMLNNDPDVRAALYAMTESTRPTEAVRMFQEMRPHRG